MTTKTKKKTKPKKRKVNRPGCTMICWSLNKDEKMREPVCPKCGKPAEMGLDMFGMPCFFHK